MVDETKNNDSDEDSTPTPSSEMIESQPATPSSDTALEIRQHRQRISLVVVTSVVTTFWTGAFFGWGPMQLLLEENGAFIDECDQEALSVSEASDGVLTCPEQKAKLLSVHFIAGMALIISPLFGMFVDKYGPFWMMLLATIFMITGLGCLMVAVASEVDWLLYVSFLFIALTTVSSHQNIMQAGLLFEGTAQQRVISSLNTLFDTGALTYLGLWAIASATSMHLEWLIGIYMLCGLVVFVIALYLWSVAVPTSAKENEQPSFKEGPAERGDSAGASYDEKNIEESSSNLDAEDENASCESPSGSTVHSGQQEKSFVSTLKANECSTADSKVDEYTVIATRSTRNQLLSKQYLLLVCFFSFHSASNIFTLTTARDFLAYLGDDETGNRYLSIFILMTPVSILGLPFMDYILNQYGYHAGFQSINILAVSFGLVKVSSSSLDVQILGFFLFSMFRCFIFTICFSFLPTFLGSSVVGRGAGLLVLSQGVTSFVNIPLSSWAVNGLDGDFFIPNLMYTVGVIPFFYIAWLLGLGVTKEKQANKTLQDNI